LSAIGKIESEAYEIENVNLKELIKEVNESINDKIRTTKAVITTDIDVEQILFSRKNLRSILYNLISNALKFSGNKAPEIHITSKLEGEFVRLSVQDHGIGMTEKEARKVFEVYKRINEDVEGQGIGLYLVKKIVHASGGKVTVETAPGKGSKFSIFLRLEPIVFS
ncbi:MAG TPA: HAMP domain-containing sensor histidine kinase, partial [Segetibacter sp.]